MTTAGGRSTRARPSRLPIAWAWLLAVALHIAALLLLDLTLRDRAVPATPTPLDIVLVRAAEPPPAPPKIVEPPTPAQPPAQPAAPPQPAPEAPAPTPAAPRPTAAAVAPAPPAQRPPPVQVQTEAQRPDDPVPTRVVLFDADGSLRVSDAVLQGDPAPVAAYIPVPREIPPWETRADPLVYEATAFEPIWKPDRESILEEFVRKQTVTKKFKTPWGTKVTCSWVLIIGGCAW